MNTFDVVTFVDGQRTLSNTYTWAQLADLANEAYSVSFTKESLRSQYRRAKGKIQPTYNLPVSTPAMHDGAITLPLQNTLVVADLHCPYHHETLLQKVKDVCGDTTQHIVIAGDLFDFGSVSRYSKSELQTRLETDLEVAGNVLLWLSEIAPITIVSGNHDERFVTKLDTSLRFRRVVSMALNGKQPKNTIQVSDYDYCFIGDDYVVGHLSQFHKTPGHVAAQLTQKYKRNVLVGHDHIRGVVENGTHIGASIGCMTDPAKHWYAQRRLNTFAHWAQGFAYITDENTCMLYDSNAQVYFARLVEKDGIWYQRRVS